MTLSDLERSFWLPDTKVQPYVRYVYVILRYVNRTLTSFYGENKLCVIYLQLKFIKVSTECVIDSRKRRR